MANDLNLGDLGITINVSEGEPASAQFTLPDGSVVTRPFSNGELSMRLGLGLGLGYQAAVGGGASAPSNTGLPVISGTATSGQTLSTTNGAWNDGGAEISGYAYQWNADGVAIGGATASTFKLTNTQIGAVITVTVTATNAAGSTAATSAGTDQVEAGALAPVQFMGHYPNTGGSPHTFTDVAFGAEDPDRLLIVVFLPEQGGAFIPGDVTIGGITAAKAVTSPGASATNHAEIHYAKVPTGLTGTIVCNGGLARGSMALYRTIRAVATPHQTGLASMTANTISAAIDCPAGGFVIAGVIAGLASSVGETWTGVTEDYGAGLEASARVTGAHQNFASAQAGLSVGVAWAAGSQTARLAVASWA